MGVVIKRDSRGRVFIRDIDTKDKSLTSTITDLDVDLLEEQAQIEADAAYEAHAFATADRIGKEVAADIRHHFEKYGPQRLDGFNWLAVIMEEFGETVAAYNQQNYEELFKEGKQAIACIMRLLVEAEREMSGASVMERDRYTRAQ